MTNSETINALNDLYIIHRHKYLKQVKGKTYTMTSGKYSNNNKTGGKFKTKPLTDSLINEHLLGKATYGVFANNKTKFMIFDFDFADDFNLCKWYFYKVRHALIEMGIAEQYIYSVFSGSKGLHLTLYFDSPIYVTSAQAIYLRALEIAYLENMSNKIEFRPTSSQGVKLPLGLHFKTSKKSCFVNNLNVDKHLSNDTILHVNKISIDTINSVLDIVPSKYDLMNDEEIEQAAATELYANVKELDIYNIGHDEEYTVSYYNDLYTNGLKVRGTRHNVTLRLAIFLKCYYQIEKEEVFNLLHDWLGMQDKQIYTSTFEEALKDTRRIVDDVFEKNYILQIKKTDIPISINELRTILTARNINDKHFTHNQKLVLFALLIHSKRYADRNSRIFYMTYSQMTNATDVKSRKSLKNAITQFEEIGLITIHRSNEGQIGTYIKLANKYEVLFGDECMNEKDKIEDNLIYDIGLFTLLINKHFQQSELKSILPRRQFEYYRMNNIG